MKPISDIGVFTIAAALPFLYGLAGHCIAQHEFYKILWLMALLFSAYAFVLSGKQTHRKLIIWLVVAVICRAVLLFSLPQWSDDYFRFIWDGRLIAHGISPFAAVPSDYAARGFPVANLDAELFQNLNSPDYYSIYPPVAQAIFATACALFPTDMIASTFTMKIILFGLELGSLRLFWKLLKSWNLPMQNILIYALNPLVIIEISGNLHFEGAMIFFLLLSLKWFSFHKIKLTSTALALSVATKLVSVLAFPFVLKHLGLRKSMPFLLLFFAILILCFSPWIGMAFFQNFGKSLDLYFRQFEFNAGLYNLVQWITRGNPIKVAGPLLAALALALIGFQIYKFKPGRRAELPEALLFAFCTYLFCATTVHPWYLCLPVAMSVFTPYRFVVWWSGLAVLSYYTYSIPNAKENLVLIAIEYSIVFFLLFSELLQHRKKVNSKGDPVQLP